MINKKIIILEFISKLPLEEKEKNLGQVQLIEIFAQKREDEEQEKKSQIFAKGYYAVSLNYH